MVGFIGGSVGGLWVLINTFFPPCCGLWVVGCSVVVVVVVWVDRHREVVGFIDGWLGYGRRSTLFFFFFLLWAMGCGVVVVVVMWVDRRQ